MAAVKAMVVMPTTTTTTTTTTRLRTTMAAQAARTLMGMAGTMDMAMAVGTPGGRASETGMDLRMLLPGL